MIRSQKNHDICFGLNAENDHTENISNVKTHTEMKKRNELKITTEYFCVDLWLAAKVGVGEQPASNTLKFMDPV